MSRPVYAVLALAVFAATASYAQDQNKPRAKTAQDVQDRLSLAVTGEGWDQGVPLRDALRYLGERYGLMIFVDTDAFKEDLQLAEADQAPIRFPVVVDVPLREVLRALCEQVQGAAIQTGTELWVVPKGQASARQLKQSVDVTFNKKALDEALKEISDQTGFNIVLDEERANNVKETARMPVTARLRSVSLEAAVRILANMAGLTVYATDKVLYVTTHENAEDLRAEDERRVKRQEKKQKEAGKEAKKPQKDAPKKETKPKAK